MLGVALGERLGKFGEEIFRTPSKKRVAQWDTVLRDNDKTWNIVYVLDNLIREVRKQTDIQVRSSKEIQRTELELALFTAIQKAQWVRYGMTEQRIAEAALAIAKAELMYKKWAGKEFDQGSQ